MRTTALVLAALALALTAAVPALTGCDPAQAGAAALVGGYRISEQQVQTESVDGLPAGTDTTDTSVTTTVVDEVPADVRDAADRMDCTAYDDGAIGCENP